VLPSVFLIILAAGLTLVNVLTQASASADGAAVGAGATLHPRLTKKSVSKLSKLNGLPSLDPGNVKAGAFALPLVVALHPVHVKLIVALTTFVFFCVHEITASVATNPVSSFLKLTDQSIPSALATKLRLVSEPTTEQVVT